MSLKFTRNTTYMPTSTPLVKAADLNEMQDEIIDLNNYRRFADDDFVGDLNTHYWTKTEAGGGTGTLAHDNAADGSGAITLNSNGTGTATIKTCTLMCGTGEFFMRARVRATGVGGSSIMRVGIDGGHEFLIAGTASTTHWRVIVNGVTTTPSVATAIGSAYALIEIWRAAGTLNFYHNRTLIYSVADATDLDGRAFLLGETGQPGALIVDSAALWLPSYL